ncbi:hypothetical protein [Brevundimonas sp.]|uniref:hypothetical protein n=1 Tax=Brevundimonas sp. TaxID=1871086 RepID=UPI003D6CDC57
MLLVAAHTFSIGIGFWLVGLGLFMITAPGRELAALARMGGDNIIHFGEMGLRALAGTALVVAAPLSKFPQIISPVGWFLILSAIIIAALPRRWHAAYSLWWARRIPLAAVRLIAPLSALAGFALIWTMLG